MNFLSKFKHIDWINFLLALTLSFISLTLIYSFNENNFSFYKQIISLLISIIIFFIVSNINTYFLKNSKFIFFLYLFSIFLLISLFFIGKNFSGATSWFSLGLFAFQPTDLVKIILVFILAKYFYKRHIEIKRIRHIFISGIYALIPFTLLFLQPDFGSAIIIFLIWFSFILIAGIPKKYILWIFGIGIIIFYILYNFLFADYQKERILTFIDPWRDPYGSGYNIIQAQIALGSGGLLGKGISEGTQTRLGFLPQAETDFILSAIGEEWGLLGILIIFLIFLTIIYRIIQKSTYGRTNFETFLMLGLAIYFSVNFFIHSGINLGILPVTGTVMPFMSYGGSHLIIEFAALGLINAINKTNRSINRNDIKDTYL